MASKTVRTTIHVPSEIYSLLETIARERSETVDAVLFGAISDLVRVYLSSARGSKHSKDRHPISGNGETNRSSQCDSLAKISLPPAGGSIDPEEIRRIQDLEPVIEPETGRWPF